jgi:hypothetical protein
MLGCAPNGARFRLQQRLLGAAAAGIPLVSCVMSREFIGYPLGFKPKYA